MLEDENTTQASKELLKEVYNSITEEDWTGVDAAEEWLQENYEPDEPEDDGPDDADSD